MANAHDQTQDSLVRPEGASDLEALERVLGHKFGSLALLERALIHRSYANERVAKGLAESVADHETLEFLGDAVLDLIISHHLMLQFPALKEGLLSTTRAQLVSEAGLGKVARELKLGQWLILGRGEARSGGRQRTSLLANTLEAIIAAIYLDGGLDAARTVVIALFAEHVPERPGKTSDYKTALQELVQREFGEEPEYELARESGPSHEKFFEVTVRVLGEERGRGQGRTKKNAEQAAASVALDVLLKPCASKEPAR